MSVRSTAHAEWKGSLKEGGGLMRLGGGFEGAFTFASRFETGQGTNPEELLAAAHAGCFSMQLSGLLTSHGHPPKSIRTTAHVTMQHGEGITRIDLETEADVPGIAEDAFQRDAEHAREICPVSRALAAVRHVTLKAKLTSA